MLLKVLEQLFILIMRPSPEPHHCITLTESHCAVGGTYADGIDIVSYIEGFEMQTG